ncbi:MAG: signal peptide peptidase SppA [bacterium]|nr:signal peptide peptidase SppA [bacterium]
MRVRTVLLLLAAAAIAVALIGGWMLWRADDGPVLGSRTVLEVDLTQGFAEDTPPEAFALSFIEKRPRLREVVSAFRRAARDDRVLGIIAKVGASPGGLGTLQELRDAVLDFADSGKRTMAYAETFGEFGAGDGGYYLATAFDEIFLQPSGDVGLTGLRYEVPFVAGTLEKLGLKAQMGQRHEFKNAVNTYTEKEFTPAHAEAMQDLVDSQFSQIVRGIAIGRGLDEDDVHGVFDRGPHFGAEALQLGLVDQLAYRDEVYEAAETEWGDKVEYRDLVSYSRFSPARIGGVKTIALIYGVGAISRGSSGYDPLTGRVRMGTDNVAQAYRDAVEDDDVRAILFRVNSPGGSYVASDTIWRETVRAREAGKPVIASFGDIAGSGGYFVAMNADRIIAQPGTITGSVGVYGGKLVSRGFWSKIGMTFDAVSTSENSEMWSGVEEFDERGWQRMEDSLDRIYADFVGKVAAGRGLPIEKVEAAARGRIWTGERAVERGLVDELGGFPAAYAAVREELDLPDDTPLALRIFPRPKSTWEVFFDRLSELDTGSQSRLSLARFERLRLLVDRLAGAVEPTDVLEMPFVPEIQ